MVTGTNLFCRSLGSALGVAVFGAVANAALGGRTSLIKSAHTNPIQLAGAIHQVFMTVVIVAVLMTIVAAFIPRNAIGLAAAAPSEPAEAAAPAA